MGDSRKAAAYSVLEGLEKESTDKGLAEGLDKQNDALAGLNQVYKELPTYAAMVKGEPTNTLSPEHKDALDQNIKSVLEQNHELKAERKLGMQATPEVTPEPENQNTVDSNAPTLRMGPR
jgi:hypothetical protein